MMKKTQNQWSVWHRSLLLALLLVVFSVAPALAQSGGNYDVEWHVIGTAGDQFASGGSYQIGFTVGQAQDTPISSGGNYQIAQGYWSGGGFQPTAATMGGFWAEARSDTLVLVWETLSEVETVGFNVYRSASGEPGTFVQANAGMILAQAAGSVMGAHYEWVDADVVRGAVYHYLLQEVDFHGATVEYGPVEGFIPQQLYLPLLLRGG